MSAKKQSAHSLAIALMVLVVLVVMVVAVGVLGSQHLNLVRANLRSTTAIYAAEAGIARSLVELKANRGWSAGFQNVEMVGEWDPGYSVAVTNNNLGGGLMTAPDGTEVPAGCVYLLATGTCRGVQPRRVAVMLKAGGGGFRYVIASGGDISLNANGDIRGSIKANGNISFNARVNIIPDQGSGRVLAAYTPDPKDPAGGPIKDAAGNPIYGSIDTGPGLHVEPGQDVRARGAIDSVAKVDPSGSAYPNDRTDDTLPFFANFNDILPEPDLDVLLAPGEGLVTHSETEVLISKPLKLNGKIHYFPENPKDPMKAISIGDVEGPGTIVVGNCGSVTFQKSIGQGEDPAKWEKLNIIGLGGTLVKFNSTAKINGLVYSQGSVETKNLNLSGYAIAFGSLRQVQSNAAVDVYRDRNLTVPGFEEWFGGGGGGSVQVMSWQRL